jgi:polysaccharide biosynthesis transport protein
MSYNQANQPSKGGDQALVPVTANAPALREPYGQLGYPIGLGEAPPEPTTLHLLLECWRILLKRKWLVIGIAAAFLVIGTVRTLMQTPLYTATVRLQIDPSGAKVVESGNVTPEDSSTEFMRTQYELLRSHTMAERVASALKLGKDQDFFKPRTFSLTRAVGGLFASSATKADEKELQDAAAGVILANQSVQPVVGSRLVDVSYSDPVPSRAQRIANAYADAFEASNQDKRFQANASAKTFLEDKIAQLKLRLEDSERALVDFAKKEEIVAVQEKQSITESNLEGAYQVGSRTIESLRNQRNALEAEYKEKQATFKPAYPAMVQIKRKIDEISKQIDAETEDMNSKVSTLKRDLLDLQKRSIEYNILKREVDTNRELYTNLLQRYKEVDVASGVGANNVFVVDRATLPGSPSSPNLRRALMIALALGLAAGFGLAYLLERLDDKVRTIEQLETLTNLSTLGVIPYVQDVKAQVADPRSALSEAYRSLCTALQFSTEHGLPKSLTITSSGPGEGKSLTSLSIARHFASLGRKVLLVDGDLRNPSQHVWLETDNSIGFSNYLTGSCAPPDVMQKIDANLAFIASGPLPPNAADLLNAPRLHSLLAIGAEVFDLIVIDGPPVLGLADAQLLSSAAAATIFVVGANSARAGHIRGALNRLQLSRGSLIGAVLTSYDAKAAGYGYGYDYGYAYTYGHNREQAEEKGQLLIADARRRISNLRETG